LGIPRILVDRDYREKIVNNVKDPVVKSFWVNEYSVWREDYRNEAIAPIQNKVGQFLNVSLIRNIVGQPKCTINIQEIMDKGKILLVNVSKGRIGEDNSALLGAMIVTKIQLTAMERIRIPEEQRRDFYLYVDEFQNFATESFANILSEARKYRLNLILAHQYISQLVGEKSTKIRDSVFGNVGTLICFRVGAGDAEFLEKEFFPEFAPLDLVRLPNYHICTKLMYEGITSRPFSAKTLPPPEIQPEKSNREKIIRVSREKYAKPRRVVEEKINRWAGVMAQTTPVSSPSGLYDALCSLCGKKIKVIFLPDPSRPVFCKSCLKKAEEGRVEILKETKKPFPKRERIKKGDELAKLGIEFPFSEEKAGKSTETIPKEESNTKDLKEVIEEALKKSEKAKNE